MTSEALQPLVIGGALLWVVSGLLALRGQRTAAVIALVLCALPVLVVSAGPLLLIAFAREAYVQQFGQAALAQLPSTMALFGASLLAVGASLLSLRAKPWLFGLGWSALLPVMAFALYMAFWFRIF